MVQDWIIKTIPRKEISLATAFIHTLLDEDFPGYYKQETITSYKKYYSIKHFQKLFRGRHIALGAYLNKELIGLLIMEIQYGGVGYIEWIGVKKEFRRQGICSALIAEGEKHAVEHHLHYLWLYTMSQDNIRYYEKRKFKLAGAHHNGWFGETDYIIEKTIHPSLFEDIFQVSD